MVEKLKHSIRLHFPYTFNTNAKPTDFQNFTNNILALKINSLANSAEFLKTNIHPDFLEESIWERGFCQLDKAIHRYGSKLLNGIANKTNSNGFFGMQPLKMSKQAINVLNNGTPNSAGKGINILLKSDALKRLDEKNIQAPHGENRWPLMFNEINFYGFNIGIGILVVDLSIQQPDNNTISIKAVEELQEIIYTICRNGNDEQSPKIVWGNGEKAVTRGLSSVVHSLMPEHTGSRIQLKATKDPGNTYAYTAISSNQNLNDEERKALIYRIARKHGETYLPKNTSEHIQYFEPYEKLTHAFSLEGAVSFVDSKTDDGNIPDSIDNFEKNAIKQAYAPLILLTYAEYLYLREVESDTTEEEMVDLKNPGEKSLQTLRVLRSSLYDFKLNFRYAQISGNTNHNLFCNYNKRALESDKILEEISSDMQEIEQYISDQVSLKQESRLRKYGIIGSIFAIILGWVEVWGLNLHEILFGDSPVPTNSIIIFISVLVVLNLSAYIVYRTSDK